MIGEEEPFFAGGCNAHLVIFGFEPLLQRLRDFFLVLDYQDGGWHVHESILPAHSCRCGQETRL